MSEHEDRIRRIEEAHGFAERTLEQLHEEVLRANREMQALSRRMDRLESRLSSLEEPSEAGDDAGDAEGEPA